MYNKPTSCHSERYHQKFHRQTVRSVIVWTDSLISPCRESSHRLLWFYKMKPIPSRSRWTNIIGIIHGVRENQSTVTRITANADWWLSASHCINMHPTVSWNNAVNETVYRLHAAFRETSGALALYYYQTDSSHGPRLGLIRGYHRHMYEPIPQQGPCCDCASDRSKGA